jgi:hypothetical protein
MSNDTTRLPEATDARLAAPMMNEPLLPKSREVLLVSPKAQPTSYSLPPPPYVPLCRCRLPIRHVTGGLPCFSERLYSLRL